MAFERDFHALAARLGAELQEQHEHYLEELGNVYAREVQRICEASKDI